MFGFRFKGMGFGLERFIEAVGCGGMQVKSITPKP